MTSIIDELPCLRKCVERMNRSPVYSQMDMFVGLRLIAVIRLCDLINYAVYPTGDIHSISVSVIAMHILCMNI